MKREVLSIVIGLCGSMLYGSESSQVLSIVITSIPVHVRPGRTKFNMPDVFKGMIGAKSETVGEAKKVCIYECVPYTRPAQATLGDSDTAPSAEEYIEIIVPAHTRIIAFLSGTAELVVEGMTGSIDVLVYNGGDFEVTPPPGALADVEVSFLAAGCFIYQESGCCSFSSPAGSKWHWSPELKTDVAELPHGYYDISTEQKFFGQVGHMAFAYDQKDASNKPLSIEQLHSVVLFINNYAFEAGRMTDRLSEPCRRIQQYLELFSGTDDGERETEASA